jgi:hypothetical protein
MTEIGKRARRRVVKLFSREAVALKVMQRLRAIQRLISDDNDTEVTADKRSL